MELQDILQHHRRFTAISAARLEEPTQCLSLSLSSVDIALLIMVDIAFSSASPIRLKSRTRYHRHVHNCRHDSPSESRVVLTTGKEHVTPLLWSSGRVLGTSIPDGAHSTAGRNSRRCDACCPKSPSHEFSLRRSLAPASAAGGKRQDQWNGKPYMPVETNMANYPGENYMDAWKRTLCLSAGKPVGPKGGL